MIYFWGLLRDCTNFLLDYKNEAPHYVILKDEIESRNDMVTINKEVILRIKILLKS